MTILGKNVNPHHLLGIKLIDGNVETSIGIRHNRSSYIYGRRLSPWIIDALKDKYHYEVNFNGMWILIHDKYVLSFCVLKGQYHDD